MIRKQLTILGLALALAVGAIPADASKRAKSARSGDSLKSEYKKSREKLETAVTEYKESLDSLVDLLEKEQAGKAADAEKLRGMLAEGLVSRREVEQAELKLTESKAKIAEARKQLEEADLLLQEAVVADELASATRGRSRGYVSSSAVIRYSGASRWAIQNIGKVQSFYATRFGRALPISAFGQSSVHNQLGFDHRNSVDVPVHPDSSEGQAILAYLRSSGIPFLAFRHAVAGKSTGAHIHIGLPSSRFR